MPPNYMANEEIMSNNSTDTNDSIPPEETAGVGALLSKTTTSEMNVLCNMKNTSNGTTMPVPGSLQSPRLLAQHAVHWYMGELDPYESHATNITTYFRPAVLALTYYTLDTTATQPTTTKRWTDYLEDSMAASIRVAHNGGTTTLKSPPPGSSPHQQQLAPATLKPLDRRTVARMEAFLNGVIWAVPTSPTNSGKKPVKATNKTTKPNHINISLVDGLSGFKHSTSLLRSISTGTGASTGGSDAGSVGTPQVRSPDLVIRLELYLRTLMRVAKAPRNQPCVLGAEPPRALKARAGAIVRAFSDTVGTVHQQGPVLTRLVTFMTKELLAVSCLSESCKKAIRRVVVDYEHQTSFASLAFLSTPDDAADQNLFPLLQRYFVTLKENWQSAERDCELEGMLQTVLDPEMRNFFKTVEFSSIGHLLETCASYRSVLQSIKLPPPPQASPVTQIQDEEQVRQALRDLQRERITINGNLLPPVKSRTELMHILSQTLNSATLTPNAVPKLAKRGRSRRSKRSVVRRSESAPCLPAAAEVAAENDQNDPLGSSFDAEEQSESCADDVSDDLNGSFVAESTIASTTASGRRRTSVAISTVDMLTKRLLLAASRTGIGGDAYFIVSDLFGGEDAQVLASQDLRGAGGAPTTTLELWLHLSSLTIQCHTKFDVYPLMQDHKNDPYSIVDCCEPLIQLHTTTTEVISLQEVRASDAATEHGFADGHFVLKERVTPQTGWRTLSIRPALYEKLQVWTTPS